MTFEARKQGPGLPPEGHAYWEGKQYPTNLTRSVGASGFHINRDIGATQEEVLPHNPERKYALLVNDSVNTIWLSLGAPAAANQGIRLNAQGGAYEINSTNLFKGRIYAVASAAASKIMITEW